ncbi:MAG: BamA/TamA family outer membrane protein [Chitinophagales bacterium]|nr:BamA/TamA family outer membrane protein [Chitinophagales bacterium]
MLTQQMRFIVLWGLLCCCCTGVLAQQQRVYVLLDAREQSLFQENIRGFYLQARDNSADTLEFSVPAAARDSFYRQLLEHFYKRSFLQASLDGPDSLKQLFLGPAMTWLSLRAGASLRDARWLQGIPFREKRFSGAPLQVAVVLQLQQQILEQSEDNGYPFARIWLDSVQIQEGGQVSAILQLDAGRYFAFRDIRLQGDVRLPRRFLPNYLGFRPGMPYSRSRVLRLRSQLQSLLFVETTANPAVSFSSEPNAATGDAYINVFLRKKKASRFDFIIGLLPQPNSNSGKLLLTGSLSAAFQNALNLGERITADLERLRPETQKVDVQAGIPYLFGTNFGADGRLGIFRRDSTWTDAQGDLGVTYWFAGANTVKFFWENKSSSLQVVDTLQVKLSRQLPENLDYRQNGFGLEAQFARLDYRYNPRSGWLFWARAVAGFNTIRRNSQIENLRDLSDPAFSFGSLYDSLEGRAARYRLEWRSEWYVPVFQRSTIKLALRSGGLFSAKTIYNNENFRLGGNKLLRGFDEESLFMTRFVVATAEYRLLIGQNSFLSAFADYGYLENHSGQNRSYLRPLGIGAGLNVETRAGIFGISAAVGRRDSGQTPDLRATKFHLGYVSLF